MVNTERMKRTFTELVSLYAPSKGEREVCEYLKKKLKSLGASKIIEDNDGSVNRGNCGNLIAVWNGNAPGLPSIALTAHMDCVEHCKDIEPILDGGVFTSKGDTILGGDDKAGVTAILEGIALMKEMYIPHGKITVIFTVQEEIGLFGSKYIEEKYIQGIDFGYVLDADGPAGSLYNAGPSQYQLSFTLKGVAAHAGMAPEKGTNAIAMAAEAITRCPTGRIDEETTCNIGTITGGATEVGLTGIADATAAATATASCAKDLDITTLEGAQKALEIVDAALTSVNSARADLGAVQNRFTSVVANLQTSSENLAASRSRIRDTDFAKETAELTRTQILQQAGTAMLAQANQVPQNVLSLLR